MTNERSGPEPTSGPYVGLRPFAPSHQPYFFGRDREVRIISSNALANPLTVLYGPGGVGKSSTLQAGVVPRLESRERTAVVYFRQWQHPQFHAELKAECVRRLDALSPTAGTSRDSAALEDRPLDDVLATRAPYTVVLLLDQFEEYLASYPPSRDSAFEAEVARLVNSEQSAVKVLISVREELLASLDRFDVRIAHVLLNRLRLDPLSSESGREAIVRPLAAYREQTGTSVAADEELVTLLLDQVAINPQHAGTAGSWPIEPAFLQLVLERLWIEHAGASRFEVKHLTHLGGARTILQQHVNRSLEALPSPLRKTARSVLRSLVTPVRGETLELMLEDVAASAGASVDDTYAVLADLERAGIVRQLAPKRFEIAHAMFGAAILHAQIVETSDAASRPVSQLLKRFFLLAVDRYVSRTTLDGWRSAMNTREWHRLRPGGETSTDRAAPARLLTNARIPYYIEGSAQAQLPQPTMELVSGSLESITFEPIDVTPRKITGEILLKGNLVPDDPVSFRLNQQMNGTFCGTREEMRESYRGNPFQREYTGTSVPYKVGTLRVEVQFPNGPIDADPEAAPVVFIGETENIDETETRLFNAAGSNRRFESDGRKAWLEVEDPVPGLLYAVSWSPPSEESFNSK
jgi:hypothetical protein